MLWSRSSQIMLSCPARITPWLAGELDELGFAVEEELIAGVRTRGSLTDAMRLNLHLRCATRVLYLLGEFYCRNPRDLYREIARIPWEHYIPPDEYLRVGSSVDNPTIRDSRFPNLKTKDAIVDRLRRVAGRRPDAGSERHGVSVFLHWKGNRASVFLDTSGEPLGRRGYRRMPWKAPMQETLAAAVIRATKWEGRGTFVNPMCGSGTLAIEAALIASGRSAGLTRENFAFMHLSGFSPAEWERMRSDAKREQAPAVDARFILSDIDPTAIEAARNNAASAGVDRLMEFHVCDFAETPIPNAPGVVVVNPEYGERLGKESELAATYARMGDFFKQQCAGYTAYVFTGNLELAKRIGLRTSRRVPFFNATIDCRLLEYRMWEGSREPDRDAASDGADGEPG